VARRTRSNRRQPAEANEAGTSIEARRGSVAASDAKEHLPRVAFSRPGDDRVEQPASSTKTSKIWSDPHLIDVSHFGFMCLDSTPCQANRFGADLSHQGEVLLLMLGGGEPSCPIQIGASFLLG
jgi:hypothetical protein